MLTSAHKNTKANYLSHNNLKQLPKNHNYNQLPSKVTSHQKSKTQKVNRKIPKTSSNAKKGSASHPRPRKSSIPSTLKTWQNSTLLHTSAFSQKRKCSAPCSSMSLDKLSLQTDLVLNILREVWTTLPEIPSTRPFSRNNLKIFLKKSPGLIQKKETFSNWSFTAKTPNEDTVRKEITNKWQTVWYSIDISGVFHAKSNPSESLFPQLTNSKANGTEI